VVVGEDTSVTALGSDLSGVPIDMLVNNAGTVAPAMDKQTLATMDSAGWLST
jgi:short-subunit dehydrogenase